MGCTVAQLSCTDSPDLVLWKAAERGDDKAIEMLIASGVDVDVVRSIITTWRAQAEEGRATTGLDAAQLDPGRGRVAHRTQCG
eukprot:SAG31_NODE_829_length_11709_cov_5.435917_4_plen_83_part_00